MDVHFISLSYFPGMGCRCLIRVLGIERFSLLLAIHHWIPNHWSSLTHFLSFSPFPSHLRYRGIASLVSVHCLSHCFSWPLDRLSLGVTFHPSFFPFSPDWHLSPWIRIGMFRSIDFRPVVAAIVWEWVGKLVLSQFLRPSHLIRGFSLETHTLSKKACHSITFLLSYLLRVSFLNLRLETYDCRW